MREARVWQCTMPNHPIRLLATLLSLLVMAGCAATAASSERTDSRRIQARMALAQAYLQGGQAAVAQHEVQQLLDDAPGYGPAWTLRGLIRRQQGDLVGAERDFRHAVQLDGRDADARHNLGWLLCEQGQHTQGAQELAQALADADAAARPRTLQAAGLCAWKAGRLADAGNLLEQAQQLAPQLPGLTEALTQLHREQSAPTVQP